MKKTDKTLQRLLSGRGDHNIDFSDLIALLVAEGFIERRGKGSHVIFTKPGVAERITLQPDGSKAKAYQVRQIRVILTRLAKPETDEEL